MGEMPALLKQRMDVHGHYFPPAYQQFRKRYHMDLLDDVKGPEWSLERQWESMDSHLLYGSDSPLTFLPVCIRQAEQMDQKLGDGLAEQIYQRNPNTLFKEVGLMR